MATLCIISILEEWENQANASEDRCKTMELSGEFTRLMADIIANAAFGSSYMEGGEAFKAKTKLQEFAANSNFHPRKTISTHSIKYSNVEAAGQEGENTIRNIIESRLNDKATGSSDHYGDDLLGGMIGASEMVQIQIRFQVKHG
ncbi:hypothetical protein EZV62_010175 [Acer yangbiense]|uniref:Uncharacterized protein n=1 Tax=Acer yangbiense TaxID=1000413 RepID=A0A5C7I1L6_9ROSI|nr:hypothetical protein EZV62_010175 [Acer yangbiense]